MPWTTAVSGTLDLEAVYVAFGSEADFAGKTVAGKAVFSFDIMGMRSDGAPKRAELRQEKIAEFRERFANPYVAAERGFVDAVIQPRETRKKLIQALAMLETKRDKNPLKKHGNIPL
jgi:propionyl-CoA carboxylase beta chain